MHIYCMSSLAKSSLLEPWMPELSLSQITSHPLGKCCEPFKFCEVLAMQLLPTPFKFSNRVGHIRRAYVKKTAQIYFSKYVRYLPPIRQPRWTPGDAASEFASVPQDSAHEYCMDKHRPCIICRLDLQNQVACAKGMRFRRRATYECRTCSHPVVLCGPRPPVDTKHELETANSDGIGDEELELYIESASSDGINGGDVNDECFVRWRL